MKTRPTTSQLCAHKLVCRAHKHIRYSLWKKLHTPLVVPSAQGKIWMACNEGTNVKDNCGSIPQELIRLGKKTHLEKIIAEKTKQHRKYLEQIRRRNLAIRAWKLERGRVQKKLKKNTTKLCNDCLAKIKRQYRAMSTRTALRQQMNLLLTLMDAKTKYIDPTSD